MGGEIEGRRSLKLEGGNAEGENAERQKFGREPTQQLRGQGLIEG